MMKPVMITADSTVDLSPELLERYDIRILPLMITLGEKSFFDGHTFTVEDMYARFRLDGTLPKTSARSVQDFSDFFRSFTEQGCAIVHFDISSELSNSYNAARMAASELEDVYVVDSRMLSTGIGLLAIDAAECREKGMDARSIAERMETLKEKVSTSFVLDTLTFMWKGGRCTGVTAFGANLMRIKPSLEMHDGKLEVGRKYHGAMRSVYRKYITDRLEGRKVRPGHVFLTESGEIAQETIAELEELIREKTGCNELHHTIAGATISSHCGPGTLGVLFIEE